MAQIKRLVWVSILTRAFARVQRPILACVLDRFQGVFCANLAKNTSDTG